LENVGIKKRVETGVKEKKTRESRRWGVGRVLKKASASQRKNEKVI